MKFSNVEATTFDRSADAPPLDPSRDRSHGEPAPQGERSATSIDWIRLLRPSQWLKNAFVLAPLLFSGRFTESSAVIATLGAVVLFCGTASGIYALNDIADRRADRAHPVKRHRPVASGVISARSALVVGIVLLLASLALGFLQQRGLGMVLVGYVCLNLAYTRRLKRIAILEVFLIAAFFVLRLLAGTTAIGVAPSVWLLLCGGLLSLFLGFSKRRHELRLLGAGAREHRAVLSDYSVEFLDQVSVVLLSVTVVSYIMYTLTSATALAVGSELLAYSSAFVLYGVFRYLYLVHQDRGGDPAETLLSDGPLQVTVVCWALYCAAVIHGLA